MGANSNIEWTHHTFNPWRGCTKVSAGCANCYAETLSHRNPKVLGIWGENGSRPVAAESYWREPLAWDREAQMAGQRHRVFCASLGDIFEARLDLEGPRLRLFNLIARTPNLDWLLLTKRPQHIRRLWQKATHERRLANVWLGTSVENQDAADERIPFLLTCRDLCPVLFLSIEPLLGPIDLRGASIDWAIVGGESGSGARPMHPHWVRSILSQCRANGIPFFFKQWGEWLSATAGSGMMRVGKKAAGRLLDGREWSEFPRMGMATAA